MMFNGLLMCGDSDTSDFTKESVGRSSGPTSSSGECDATRAEYYHNKLLATMQILQNKEETVRIQAESLAVAEARIASLTARGVDLRKEIDKKTRELSALRKSVDVNRVERTDVSITAQLQEIDQQKNMVTTLQNNLGVIEDLYRECFYESAKQEGLIEMLRTSYLDVRLMEKEKSNQIGRLQNVINTQKWSFEQCQDIATEVENLKMEISNFLNSSNNDSGMWERSSESISPGLGDDLHDIMDQLLRLRELLTGDCTCGLEEENMRLKQTNGSLEIQIAELRDRIVDLETTLLDKETLDTRLQHDVNRKEEELNKIRQKIASLEETSSCHSANCDTLSKELQQAEELVNEKTARLVEEQERCQVQENTIQELRVQLEDFGRIFEENCKMKSEIGYLRSEMSVWRSQLCKSEARIRSLEGEVSRLTTHCAHLDCSCKEQFESATELRAQLEEAHSRGAALCAEARHAARAVRHWADRMRAKHKEQESQIKAKENLLSALQRRIDKTHVDGARASASENEICTKCIPKASERSDSYTSCVGARQQHSVASSASEKEVCSKYIPCSASCTVVRDRQHSESRGSENRCHKCTFKDDRRETSICTSGGEIASCSSAPVPPRRLFRKKPHCGDKRCDWQSSSNSRDACVQLPIRRDASTCFPPPTLPPKTRSNNYGVNHVHVARTPRELSPAEELMSRVERLSEALADGQRRWTRGRQPRET